MIRPGAENSAPGFVRLGGRFRQVAFRPLAKGGAVVYAVLAAANRGPRKAALQALWGEEAQRNEEAFPVRGKRLSGACADEGGVL